MDIQNDLLTLQEKRASSALEMAYPLFILATYELSEVVFHLPVALLAFVLVGVIWAYRCIVAATLNSVSSRLDFLPILKVLFKENWLIDVLLLIFAFTLIVNTLPGIIKDSFVAIIAATVLLKVTGLYKPLLHFVRM